MKRDDFNPRQQISRLIAFTFIILLSLTLGWYSIKTSEDILVNMPNSKIVNISRRMQAENLQEKTETKNTSQGGSVEGQLDKK